MRLMKARNYFLCDNDYLLENHASSLAHFGPLHAKCPSSLYINFYDVGDDKKSYTPLISPEPPQNEIEAKVSY